MVVVALVVCDVVKLVDGEVVDEVVTDVVRLLDSVVVGLDVRVVLTVEVGVVD